MRLDNSNKKYPRNAPGPFYVANGECITCMLFRFHAAGLFNIQAMIREFIGGL